MSRYEVFRDADRVATSAAMELVKVSRDAISRRGACFIALPGGSAPRALYRALCAPPIADKVDWSRLHFFVTDERLVAGDHADSTVRLLATALFEPAGVPESNRHQVQTDLPAADAAAAYSADIARTCGDDGLDLVVLGMGADGRVGSHYPDGQAIDVSARGACVANVPQLGTKLVTLTFGEIESAGSQLVLAADPGCARTLAEVRSGGSDSPAGRLAASAIAEPLWLTDWATASAMHDLESDSLSSEGDQKRIEELKELAGAAAADEVESGMIVGLGTGSTARYVVESLGAKWRLGEITDIEAIPTSQATEILARIERLPLVDLATRPRLDLTIDGADEISPEIDLIKGLGGALLREKIVADASDRLAIVADRGKLVPRLGTQSPVPVAVTPFGWQQHTVVVRDLGGEPTLRTGPEGDAYVTDDGLYILDCRFPDGLSDPESVDRALRERVGVVETGFFLDMAESAYVTDSRGVLVYRR